jgi:hypothetical protein
MTPHTSARIVNPNARRTDVKRFVTLDFRNVTALVYKGGGKTIGYGVFLGKSTFLGIVRATPRMRPARRRRLSKAERRYIEEQRRKVVAA